MRSAVFVAALVAAVSAQLRIDTPTSLIECQPAKIAWSGGTAPYYPAVIPGGQPSANALKTFPQTSDTSLTWTVDLATGQEVTMRITDSTGAINYAEKVAIQAGSSKTCLMAAGSSGNSSVAASGSASSSGVRASASSASGAVAGVASSAAASVSSVSSAARSGVSSASNAAGSATSMSGSQSASGSRAAASASSSAAAGYLGAEPKLVGGLLGVVASIFGVLAM